MPFGRHLGEASVVRRLVVVAVIPALAGAVLIGVALASRQGPAQASTAVPAHLTGELTHGPPWPRNVPELRERLAELHLPALAYEGTVLHIHQHLDVFDNGRRVIVPAGIGIGDTFISPLHTHDTSGVMHVESPTIRPFTLAEFFGVWGAPLAHAKVYVDGKRSIPGVRLEPHQEIAVVFGRAPRRIPSSYDFPFGL
jgi:hypothetical protein